MTRAKLDSSTFHPLFCRPFPPSFSFSPAYAGTKYNRHVQVLTSRVRKGICLKGREQLSVAAAVRLFIRLRAVRLLLKVAVAHDASNPPFRLIANATRAQYIVGLKPLWLTSRPKMITDKQGKTVSERGNLSGFPPMNDAIPFECFGLHPSGEKKVK